MPHTSLILDLHLPPALLDVGFYPFVFSVGMGALFSVAPSSNLGRLESASSAPVGWTLLTSASGGLGGPSGPLLTPAGRGGLYADLFARGLGTTLMGIPIFRLASAWGLTKFIRGGAPVPFVIPFATLVTICLEMGADLLWSIPFVRGMFPET
jgi:hypothetical protein